MFNGHENYQPTEVLIQKHPKIKMKKWHSRLVDFAEIALQQHIMILSSSYGPQTLMCMFDNIGHPNETADGVPGELLQIQTSLSSWTTEVQPCGIRRTYM